ncbi:MAG TPA: tRNA (guanosine(37)-N1)-methyltransferase TrmD, partial [Armatimonadota bacterium]|nr:tRNA (guanosine(37)-N1)-methyltransferase TrmD [Armatimonadota bacterium]
MRADIVTIFPEMVTPVLSTSMLQRGQESGLLDLRAVDLRDYAEGRHNQVDDTPYGGGAGMVLQPDPLFRCVEDLTADSLQARVI